MEYDYIAVTAACMMVSKEKFEEVGGFEEGLAIAYNDVDFCFKLLEHGYYNIVRNDAVLLHYESVSRGDDLVDETKVKRLQEEQKVLYERHPQFYNYDPFYNVNLCQYDVNFTNNYDRTEVHYNQILPKMPKTKETDRLLANVDIIRKLSRVLYLEGWAFLDGYRKNNDNDVKLVLYNDENKYVIETDKVYRQDVAEAFPDKDDIEFTVATGYGRITYKEADKQITELSCHAKGVAYLVKDARTIIDIGGQDAKVIKLDANGQMVNFGMNEKCAAGTGRFLEVMARVLGCTLSDLSDLAKQSDKEVSISSVCTVFAESEVISQLAGGEKIANVARGAHVAIAKRVAGMCNRVGVEPKVVMTGGVALNADMVDCMAKELGVPVQAAPDCQAAGAIGAALAAYDAANRK